MMQPTQKALRRRLAAILCAASVALALASPAPTRATPGQHTLEVSLNYDFTADIACSASVTKACLLQFNIYDLTSGTPVKLFSFPAPPGATGPVTGITATSALLPMKSGIHTFGATAQMADGTESSPNACTATATVSPGSPVTFTLTVN
jgi:hypothetical protein